MMKFFRRQASQPAAKPGEKPAAPRRMGPPKFTPEQQAEIDKYKEEVKAWRLGLDLSKVEGARKLLSDAGISVHIVKMHLPAWDRTKRSIMPSRWPRPWALKP